MWRAGIALCGKSDKRRDHGEETLAEIGRSYNVSGWTISRLRVRLYFSDPLIFSTPTVSPPRSIILDGPWHFAPGVGMSLNMRIGQMLRCSRQLSETEFFGLSQINC